MPPGRFLLSGTTRLTDLVQGSNNNFLKVEVTELMQNAGLTNIILSNTVPFYHAVGHKV